MDLGPSSMCTVGEDVVVEVLGGVLCIGEEYVKFVCWHWHMALKGDVKLWLFTKLGRRSLAEILL